MACAADRNCQGYSVTVDASASAAGPSGVLGEFDANACPDGSDRIMVEDDCRPRAKIGKYLPLDGLPHGEGTCIYKSGLLHLMHEE